MRDHGICVNLLIKIKYERLHIMSASNVQVKKELELKSEFEKLKEKVKASTAADLPQNQFDLAMYYLLKSASKIYKETGLEHSYDLSKKINAVERVRKQGMEWLTKAAKNKYAKAQHHLGYYYFRGTPDAQRGSFPKDSQLGLDWMSEAASQGYTRAEFELGVYYLNGDSEVGICKEEKKSFDLLQNVAKKGSKAAQFIIAKCYFEGKGVEKNEKTGFDYLNMLVAQETTTTEPEKFDWDDKRWGGYIYYQLSECYRLGLGVAIDQNKEIEFLDKSLCENCLEAIARLRIESSKEVQYGVGMLSLARKTKQDNELATELFKLAAIRKHLGAIQQVQYQFDLFREQQTAEGDKQKIDKESSNTGCPSIPQTAQTAQIASQSTAKNNGDSITQQPVSDSTPSILTSTSALVPTATPTPLPTFTPISTSTANPMSGSPFLGFLPQFANAEYLSLPSTVPPALPTVPQTTAKNNGDSSSQQSIGVDSTTTIPLVQLPTVNPTSADLECSPSTYYAEEGGDAVDATGRRCSVTF